jgi:pyruvate dehydrogenase E2 component (dihydrolipoyllysine-residue acetyltransferase)
VPAANAAALGNATTVHIVDGVGHMAHMEKPQAVVAAIREALGA